MAQQIQLIPVFIGSPSGLEDERRAARKIVSEINKNNSKHWGCQLELVGWEETLPGHGRPQSLINKDLDRCDHFIGVIHDHWGSPPDTTSSKYTSGFEEEFERAKAHVVNGRMKSMTVFFKAVSEDKLKDPGKSLTKVLEFREKSFANRDGLYREFSITSEFEGYIRDVLTNIGWTVFDETQRSQSKVQKANISDSVESREQIEKTETNPLFDKKAQNFLGSLLERSSEWEKTSPAEVARLRLIANSVKRSGNDNQSLGAHDANLLHLSREQFSWSSQEINVLIETGVASFESQNTPLWYWLSKEKTKCSKLWNYASFGEDNTRFNAIKLLRLLGTEFPNHDIIFSRENILAWWLSPDSSDIVFNESIKYLKQHGTPDHLPILREIRNKAIPSRKDKIAQAILAIELLYSPQQALNSIIDLNIADIDAFQVDQIFSAQSHINSAQLNAFLTSGSASVRKAALHLLSKRNELNTSDIDPFLNDSNYEIRFEAAIALKKLGNELSPTQLKSLLVHEGGTGLLSPSQGNTYYNKYIQMDIEKYSQSELKDKAKKEQIACQETVSTLYLKYPKANQREIRTYLNDGFKSFFEPLINNLSLETGGNPKQMWNLMKFYQDTLTSDALTALCSLRSKLDLNLIRHTVDNFEINASKEILGYFEKFGTDEDFDRICKLGDTPKGRTTALTISTTSMPREKAKALVRIAYSNIPKLLKRKLDLSIRREVLSLLNKRQLTDLSDAFILDELKNNDQNSRKILAQSCCLNFTKKRNTQLLEKYLNLESGRFYNVVHWLDLAASMPTSVTKKVVTQDMTRSFNIL